MEEGKSSYKQAFDDARAELEDIFEEESRMEKRREEMERRKEILIKMMKTIGQFLGKDMGKEQGLTDAIREILSERIKVGRTPASIRNRLREMEFDIDSYSNPLAVIHTTLKRLTKQGEVKVKRRDGGRRVYYCTEDITVNGDK